MARTDLPFTAIRRDFSSICVTVVLLSAALLGCGKVASDASSRGGDGAGPASDAGVQSSKNAGGRGGSDNEGAGGSHGGRSGNGGASLSDADSGPVPVGGAPAAGGSPSSDGGVDILDPHAEQRRELATASCSLAQRFPCLSIISDGLDQNTDVCRAQTEANSYTRFGEACWNEWMAHMKCALNYADYCPCNDGAGHDYCVVNPQLNNFGKACLTTKAALDACEMSLDNVGTVTGSAGEFTWEAQPGGGCQSMSVETNVPSTSGETTVGGRIQALCSGPPGGGQTCNCYANGHIVEDLVDLTLTGGAYMPWQAASCGDVATQLAAGRCSNLLSCCFTYIQETLDGQKVETCGCGSDPSRAGYGSCEEFAAAANGTLVDICPEWKVPGNFPIKTKP